MKKNILVLYGGRSVEHDISIITGLQMIENIDKNKYNVIPVYISRSGTWYKLKDYNNIKIYKDIEKCKKRQVCLQPNSIHLYEKLLCVYVKTEIIDCVYLCTHGTNCEDGSLQGLIESCRLAYTGSNILSSAIGMDKIIMKDIFRANGIPCVKYIYLTKNSNVDLRNIKLNYPLIVKPSNLGSSIGINRCESFNELLKAVDIAFKYDGRVIIEEAVSNLREINCSVIGTRSECECSSLEEPINWSKILTFEEKYINNRKLAKNTKVKIKKSVRNQIYNLSKKVYKTFCCSGVVRIDFLIDNETQKVYVNEINTIPGSLAFYLWQDERSFKEHINYTIELALKEKQDRDKLIYDFNSNALDEFGKGAKTKGKC